MLLLKRLLLVMQMLLHVLRSEHEAAVSAGLACLRLFGVDLPAHPSAAQAVPALVLPQQRLRNTGAALARSVSACAMSRGFHPPKCAHSQSQPGRSLSPTLGPARSMGGDHRSPGPPPKRLTNRPGRCRRQGAVLGPSALFATANQ